MSGIAISPYDNLWFVGTDMGTLYRSSDNGKSWAPVNHFQATFDSKLENAVSPGFSADGKSVFHAAGGVRPQVSRNSGLTFEPIEFPLAEGELITYWSSDSKDTNRIYAGTTTGLWRSEDNGGSWTKASGIDGKALGTFVDSHATGVVYHALSSGIYKSTDYGASFTLYFSPAGVNLRKFTGGRDGHGLRLAFIDDDGRSACAWAEQYESQFGLGAISENLQDCGFVWSGNGKIGFVRTTQVGGDHLAMAENDSRTIYVTGGRKWVRQYGTKVHISRDGGHTWKLKLHQLNWDVVPFAPWPSSRIEYSAIANDVGWFDDGYESFAVNKRNSAISAGSGLFFLHASYDHGTSWKAPFTRYEGDKSKNRTRAHQRWSSGGIEVNTIYRVKFHPKNPNLLYAAAADIGGLVSTDSGKSFRVSKAKYNSNYDYAFDPNNDQVVYAASGNVHDWPDSWHANPIDSDGGIFKSYDRGRSWKRLTPDNDLCNRQFLSIAYDHRRNIIYAGSQEVGIIRSADGGRSWATFNQGLPKGIKIIPQIEVDPENGNVYALLTGDAPNFTNRKFTGIYHLNAKRKSTTWELLRETVHYPLSADQGYDTWFYPTAFAVDWSDPSRETLWLVDYENNRNWLMTGVWKTEDRGRNWNRMLQMTHPYGVTIDPRNSNRVHVSGSYKLDGSWGQGGQLYTVDGGETWKKDHGPSLQMNARQVTLDPRNPSRIYYTYFGAGILLAPNPASN